MPVPDSDMVVEPPAAGADGAAIAGVGAAAGFAEGPATDGAGFGAAAALAASAAAVFCLLTTHN